MEESNPKFGEFRNLVASDVVRTINKIIALATDPTITSWLEIAFEIDEVPLNIDDFNAACREAFAKYGSVQNVLNAKAKPDVSDDPQIVKFVSHNLQKKCKVNCLGNALVAILVAQANDIKFNVWCSETHTWISIIDKETKEEVIVDVADNIKARKKSALPLSIYANGYELDNFALCMLIITNDNDLSDEAEFLILHHFAEKQKLKYSWETSKLFSLGWELKHPNYGTELINRYLSNQTDESMEFQIQRCLYNIQEKKDMEESLVCMKSMLDKVTEYCRLYNMNIDAWILPKCSLLYLANQFIDAFGSELKHDLSVQAAQDYEEWISNCTSLAETYLPRVSDKFKTAAPTISGKRRRVMKDLS